MEEIINILKNINSNIDYLKEDRLMDNGIIDSLGIITIVIEIQELYNIEIDPEYITPENFNSARSIYELVDKIKKGN